MISSLQGTLTAKFHDHLEIDVDGVGYEVFVSQKTLHAAPPVGQTLLLKTHLYVREDALQLFGFLTEAEKQAFLLALSASGVGPKAAMSILSTFTPDSFYQAVLHNDLSALRSIPGIGPKSAQHLVLELKDKVTKMVGAGVFPEESPQGAGSRTISDALQAMMALGYSAAESRRAVLASVQALGEKSTVEEILRSSLKLVGIP